MESNEIKEDELRNFWFENRYKYVVEKQKKLTISLANQLKEGFLYPNGTFAEKLLKQIQKADNIRKYYIERFRIETGLKQK
jgi:hypothetical protein